MKEIHSAKFTIMVFTFGAIMGRSSAGGPNADLDNSGRKENALEPLVPASNNTKSAEKEYTEPSYLVKNYPYYLSGRDHDGIPVFVAEFGKWNFKNIRIDQEEEFLNYTDNFVARIVGTGEEKLQGVGIIIDFDGFTLNHFSSTRGVKLGLKMFQYVGKISSVLNYGFFINGNFAAEAFLNLGRPFLGSVLERVEIFGSQKEKWMPRLLRKIPRENLPPHYGGIEDFKPIATYG